MKRKRDFPLSVTLIPLFLLTFCAMPLTAQTLPFVSTAKFDSPKIIYVESAAAPDRPSRERIETSLSLLQKEIGVEAGASPEIVVIHISVREAALVGLANVSVKLRVNNDSEKSAKPYYELWLVGTPSAFQYTLALNSLLEHHYKFHHEEAQQMRAIDRVTRYLEATVSARVD